ncbi:MAG: DUF1648 domain-containing protein [Pyrinomonadaceae bacterium]
MHFARKLLIILVIAFCAHCSYYYPLLPPTLASHFDGHGNPNGWMSKPYFFALEGVLLGIMIAISLLMPKILEKSPNKWINLPNREYWLAEERKPFTIEMIGRYHEWFSAALLVLFIAVNQLVFQANIVKQPLPSGPMWTLLISFFVFVGVWLVMFYRKFRIPE